MVTLFLTFALMPVLVFLGITAQRWLFRNSTVKTDRNGNSTSSGMTSRGHDTEAFTYQEQGAML